jgi:hypothetical protein
MTKGVAPVKKPRPPQTQIFLWNTGNRRGRQVNWAKPPKPTAMCIWSKRTTGGKIVKGSFRSIAWLDRANRIAWRRFGVGLEVIQSAFNVTVKASAGTHDLDACFDIYIPGVDWWTQQRFFRSLGFGCWYRHPPLFGNHIHGFVLPPAEGFYRNDDFRLSGIKVGVYVDGGWSQYGHLVASSQIEDYYDEAFGLSEQHTPGTDNSWFPPDKDATIFDLERYCKTRARAVAA